MEFPIWTELIRILFFKLRKVFESGQESSDVSLFSRHHMIICRCIQTHDPFKGISRYNESHFHYDGYTFELAEEFSFLNLSNSNTFPING